MPRKRRDPDERVRCVCGQEEVSTPKRRGAESFLVKCEQCQCWQHGQCVGLASRDAPEQYWCENCRPDLHELKSSSGKISSKYLQSASDSDGYEDERDRRKRRRTMNSREDDILQRVLEQSAREEKLRLAKLKNGDSAEVDVDAEAETSKDAEIKTEDPRSPQSPEERPKRKRKPAKRKAATPAPPTGAGAASTTSASGINKKLRPKIPSPRISLYEMRKRIGSILEFSSTTQGEMVLEEAARKEILDVQRQRGDSPALAKFEQLYNEHKINIEALESLTEKLLNWQERFS